MPKKFSGISKQHLAICAVGSIAAIGLVGWFVLPDTGMTRWTEPQAAAPSGISVEGDYLASRLADQLYDRGRSAEFYLSAASKEGASDEIVIEAFAAQYCCGTIEDAAWIAGELEARDLGTPFLQEPAAALAVGEEDWEAALVIARSMAENGESMVMAAIIEGWALAAMGDGDGATQSLDRAGIMAGLSAGGIATPPTYMKLQRLLLAEWLGREDEASRMADELLTETFDSHLVMELAAHLARAGRLEDAHQLVEERMSDFFNKRAIKRHLRLSARKRPEARQMVGAGIMAMALAAKNRFEDRNITARLQFSLHVDDENHMARLELATDLSSISPERALDLYDQLGNRNPVGQAARFYEKTILKFTGELDRAAQKFRGAIRHNPRNVHLRETLAEIYREAYIYIQARQAYTRSLALGSDVAETNRYLGLIEYFLGNHAKAELHFLEAIEANPEDYTSLNFLGYWYAQENRRLDIAMEYVQRAAEKRPNSGFIIDSLGWVHYRLGNLPKAVDYLERATSLQPGNSEITGHLGDAYWAIGRHDEARFKWRLAMRLATKDADRELFARRIEVGLEAADLPGSN